MTIEIERLARLEEKLDMIYQMVQSITSKDTKTDEEIIILKLKINTIETQLKITWAIVGVLTSAIILPWIKKALGVG